MLRKLGTFAVLAILAAPQFAQLDLPRGGSGGGRPKASKSDLDLPDRRDGEGEVVPSSDSEDQERESREPETPNAYGAARALFAELAGLNKLSDPRLLEASQELVALGRVGVAQSRVELSSPSSAVQLAAARVLLTNADAKDRKRVLNHLKGRFPARVGPRMLQMVLELAPVHASPEYLVELLDHPQTSLRAAVEDHLEDHLTAELLPLLERSAFRAGNDAKVRSLNLIAQIDDPSVISVLSNSLGDKSSAVASTAASFLARSEDPRVEEALLELCTDQPVLLRRGAYALLAVAEREDRKGRVLLHDEHSADLLAFLNSESELVKGASAIALAGIGFRSSQTESTEWLDLLVPHLLVRCVSGANFHSDLSSLQGHAQRRLKLISGKAFGTDGPAWQEWWSSQANQFRARRARLSIEREDLPRLRVEYRSLPEAQRIVLRGPEVTAGMGGLASNETLLTLEECADLVRILRQEGALGPERLPSTSTTASSRTRSLDISVGKFGKSFSTELVRAEAWFERIVDALENIEKANRWQFYVSAENFEAEAEWWSQKQSKVSRARRLTELVLSELRVATGAQRLRLFRIGLEDVERYYALPGVPNLSDFNDFCDLIRGVDYFGEDVRRLVDLSLASGSANPTSDVLDDSLSQDLLSLLIAKFGHDATDAIAQVLTASGMPVIVARARDERSILRAGAARALAQAQDPRSEAILMELLADEDLYVERAAVEALGLRSAKDALTQLLERARSARTPVRIAALHAVAGLGDSAVLDTLVSATSDLDPEVRRAAAEGLAILGDPSTVPILISLLARGESAAVYGPARRGLLALGDRAHEALLRLIQSGRVELSRDAALLLALQGHPQAAAELMEILGSDPEDSRVAWELAVLSGQDFRHRADPAGSWRAWWEVVVHDDSLVWFLAAAERLGVRTPERASMLGEGSREAAEFLLSVLERGRPHEVERARRELGRLTGEPLEELSASSLRRSELLAKFTARVEERWPQ